MRGCLILEPGGWDYLEIETCERSYGFWKNLQNLIPSTYRKLTLYMGNWEISMSISGIRVPRCSKGNVLQWISSPDISLLFTSVYICQLWSFIFPFMSKHSFEKWPRPRHVVLFLERTGDPFVNVIMPLNFGAPMKFWLILGGESWRFNHCLQETVFPATWPRWQWCFDQAGQGGECIEKMTPGGKYDDYPLAIKHCTQKSRYVCIYLYIYISIYLYIYISIYLYIYISIYIYISRYLYIYISVISTYLHIHIYIYMYSPMKTSIYRRFSIAIFNRHVWWPKIALLSATNGPRFPSSGSPGNIKYGWPKMNEN